MDQVLILAAGKGTRMNSDKPKVLHELANKPMLKYVFEEAISISPKPITVVGYGHEQVRRCLEGESTTYIIQDKQLGTGHAVSCARDYIDKEGSKNIFILPGDHPLIKAETLKKIVEIHKETSAIVTIGTVKVPNFEGVFSQFLHSGRIVRDENGKIVEIIEYKDATDKQKEITEVNVSYYCFDSRWLCSNLSKLGNTNASQEYYITDLPKLASSQKQVISSFEILEYFQALGANTPEQLTRLEQYL
ncbi:MAG: hypothetical protein A2725_00935 [Candidatus Magasanikbacteria bacterium RIFCSPHIGHO2_01_FULL_33_34]|uniref:MobA-like NTP transferase domain-containing protein n=1 Tax=Candidatus Magasanikbacteria bacterium RIFCSPHIGHO2_01_FULL_33_34 TaxID=1798671 RepID=A0A1F6LIY9_9BACT|nr:MAG: hypothetical protein A2725_00935 [Candidatus Magasanikbacteria bacterium RIFCSPHIGHO2_01_FULL_33_34]OGH65321.1 MAG: hypothetical protein A3B83_04595 [Candidatus Magasanikbacteria bacterium RIFCSPHIGHO2_02_FULL_33_17]OGH76097.1 MAG: hypothetical protein A3A89_01515 [Candidatus Magasanikbacteria bacterium RIFCSPLOWO2_01_FULL_33_34]OGH82077.1 MAG: hypothetical protein A3F93_04325 [Candidatus Magasanikbacteria bacterium RIFCSPLOWO2_12_FULL_34_7]